MLVALEIDGTQQPLIAAAAKPHRRVAGVAPPARPQLALDQRLVRLLRRNVVGRHAGTVTQRLSSRSISLNRHIDSLLYRRGFPRLTLLRRRRQARLYFRICAYSRIFSAGL